MAEHWTDDPVVTEILSRYAAGQSVTAIAAGLRRPYPVVWTVLRRTGLVRPQRRRNGARDRYLIRRGVMP